MAIVFAIRSQDPNEISQIKFQDNELTIGRSKECSYQVQNQKVSSKHLLIKRNPDNTIFIKDLNSSNGTFLNGKKVSEGVFGPNDSILIGTLKIEIDQTQLNNQERNLFNLPPQVEIIKHQEIQNNVNSINHASGQKEKENIENEYENDDDDDDDDSDHLSFSIKIPNLKKLAPEVINEKDEKKGHLKIDKSSSLNINFGKEDNVIDEEIENAIIEEIDEENEEIDEENDEEIDEEFEYEVEESSSNVMENIKKIGSDFASKFKGLLKK